MRSSKYSSSQKSMLISWIETQRSEWSYGATLVVRASAVSGYVIPTPLVPCLPIEGSREQPTGAGQGRLTVGQLICGVVVLELVHHISAFYLLRTAAQHGETWLRKVPRVEGRCLCDSAHRKDEHPPRIRGRSMTIIRRLRRHICEVAGKASVERKQV